MQKERQDETQFTTNIDGFLMEALMQKERQDETQFTTKIDGFLNVRFCRFFFFESHHVYDQTQRVLVLCFSYFTTDNSNILPERRINI